MLKTPSGPPEPSGCACRRRVQWIGVVETALAATTTPTPLGEAPRASMCSFERMCQEIRPGEGEAYAQVLLLRRAREAVWVFVRCSLTPFFDRYSVLGHRRSGIVRPPAEPRHLPMVGRYDDKTMRMSLRGRRRQTAQGYRAKLVDACVLWGTRPKVPGIILLS